MSVDYDLGDEVLVPLVAGLLAEHRAAARAVWDGPLPRLRAAAFADAPRAVQTATLVFLGSAWTFGMPGSTVLKDAALDVHGGDPIWRRAASDLLQRRERIPRAPARCGRCHRRLTTGGGPAA